MHSNDPQNLFVKSFAVQLQFKVHIFCRIAFLRKLFDIGFSYKHVIVHALTRQNGVENRDKVYWTEGIPGGTPLYKPYRYVQPQKVWFLGRFGLKTGKPSLNLVQTVNRLSVQPERSQANHFGGAQSKGLATRRNVSTLTFLEQDWARKVCRFSVLFSLPAWKARFYSAI